MQDHLRRAVIDHLKVDVVSNKFLKLCLVFWREVAQQINMFHLHSFPHRQNLMSQQRGFTHNFTNPPLVPLSSKMSAGTGTRCPAPLNRTMPMSF
jgi:hypothetical protein